MHEGLRSPIGAELTGAMNSPCFRHHCTPHEPHEIIDSHVRVVIGPFGDGRKNALFKSSAIRARIQRDRGSSRMLLEVLILQTAGGEEGVTT